MMNTRMTITGPEGTQEVQLDPNGLTVGRSSDCDIVLDSSHVSRVHARIFQDPFGRWVIEDLDSHNGVFVNGQRVEAQAILPGETISIASFRLSILQDEPQQTGSGRTADKTMATVATETIAEVVAAKKKAEPRLIKQLNEMTQRLLSLGNTSELYPEACRQLATVLGTPVAVISLPIDCTELPSDLEVLAWDLDEKTQQQADPQPFRLHLSRRVLNAVRTERSAVMGRSGPSDGQAVTLTVVDAYHPHLVFCAPAGDAGDSLAVIYTEIPADSAPTDMLEFIEAVGHQIAFVQKSLRLSEARTERRLLDQQLSLARDIQAQLTPSGFDKGLATDIAIAYEPAMWVGGDYCDLWSLADGRLAFAIGDVSGKGLPAAMIMANLQAAIRTTMTFCSDLSSVAGHVNCHLMRTVSYGTFVTLFLGLYDPPTGRLECVNAGHVLPVVVHPSGSAEELGKPVNSPLGLFEQTFELTSTQLCADAALVVVTDGITEARSPAGQYFDPEKLKQTLSCPPSLSAQGIVDLIIERVSDFRQSAPQQDDMTALALVNNSPCDQTDS